jgi:hypothetical protein
MLQPEHGMRDTQAAMDAELAVGLKPFEGHGIDLHTRQGLPYRRAHGP